MENVNYAKAPVGAEKKLSLWGYFKRCIMEKYAKFSGRARRREYWGFYLWYCVFVLFLEIPFLSMQSSVQSSALYGTSNGALTLAYTVLLILKLLLVVGILVPFLSVTVRRLHDIGKSGWWYLIALIPLIGGIVLLVFLVRDSEPFANRFGESPKYGSVTAG